MTEELRDTDLRIPAGMISMPGELHVPAGARGLVLLPRTGSADALQRAACRLLGDTGFATLMVDLLTADEAAAERRTAHVRFDGALLATRIVAAIDWLEREAATAALPVGILADASGAALIATVRRPDRVRVVAAVAGADALPPGVLDRIGVPVLLLLPSDQRNNEAALRQLTGQLPASVLQLLADDTQGARAASDWFADRLPHPTLVAA